MNIEQFACVKLDELGSLPVKLGDIYRLSDINFCWNDIDLPQRPKCVAPVTVAEYQVTCAEREGGWMVRCLRCVDGEYQSHCQTPLPWFKVPDYQLGLF